jgi:hypothetical protein
VASPVLQLGREQRIGLKRIHREARCFGFGSPMEP